MKKQLKAPFSSPEPLGLICNRPGRAVHLGRSEHGPLAFSSPEPLVSLPRDQETMGSGDENAKGPCSLRPRCIALPVLQKKHFAQLQIAAFRVSSQSLLILHKFAKSWFKRKSKQVVLAFFFTSFWIFWSGIEPV